MVSWIPATSSSSSADANNPSTSSDIVSRRPYSFEGELSNGCMKGELVGPHKGVFELKQESGIICFSDMTPVYGPLQGGTIICVSCLGTLGPAPAYAMPELDRLHFRFTTENEPGVKNQPIFVNGIYVLTQRSNPFPRDDKEAQHVWSARCTVPPGLKPGPVTVDVGLLPPGIEPFNMTEPLLLQMFAQQPADTSFIQVTKRQLLLALSETLESAKTKSDLFLLKEKIRVYPGTPETELLIVRDETRVFGKDYYLCTTVESYEQEAKRLASEHPPRTSRFMCIPRKFIYYNLPDKRLKFEPTEGPVNGGTLLTIQGSCFLDTGCITVQTFDGSIRKTVSGVFKSDTCLECRTPSCDYDGSVYLSVSLNGQQYIPIERPYFYIEPFHWRVLPSTGRQMPCPRSRASIAVLHRRLVMFGGNDGKDDLPDLWVYNLGGENEWMPVPTTGVMPVMRESCTAVFMSQRLYVLGSGYGAPGNTDTVNMLDTNHRRWTELSTVTGDEFPSCAGAICVSLKDQRILLVGGSRSTTDVSVLETGGASDSLVWLQVAAKGELLLPIMGHTATRIGRKVFVFGGRKTDGSAVNALRVLDLEEMKWLSCEASGMLPSPRWGHGAANIGHGLYIFGGRDKYRIHADLYRLDLKNLVWVSVHSPTEVSPSPRWDFASTSSGNLIYIYGGNSEKGLLTDMYELKVDQCTRSLKESHGVTSAVTLGFQPRPRAGHTATVVGRQMYVFGGYYDGWQYLNDLFCFNLDTHTWSPIETTGPVPSPRWGHVTVLVDRRLLVFGGYGGSGRYLNDLHLLDIDTMRWTSVPPASNVPEGMYGHTGVVYERRIIFFGGCHNGKRREELCVLDADTLEWKKTSPAPGPHPEAVQCHTAVVVGRQMWVFGGCRQKDVYTNSLHALDLDAWRWTRPEVIGDAPDPRMAHSCCLVGQSRLVFFGGCGSKPAFNDLTILDTEKLVWSKRLSGSNVGPLGLRYWHTAVSSDCMVYIFGGQCSAWKFLNEVLTACVCYACS